jgi:hypothetical protein
MSISCTGIAPVITCESIKQFFLLVIAVVRLFHYISALEVAASCCAFVFGTSITVIF